LYLLDLPLCFFFLFFSPVPWYNWR
jgi:hypothetical protein